MLMAAVQSFRRPRLNWNTTDFHTFSVRSTPTFTRFFVGREPISLQYATPITAEQERGSYLASGVTL
jgi:hypothetical protein